MVKTKQKTKIETEVKRLEVDTFTSKSVRDSGKHYSTEKGSLTNCL